MKPVCHLYVSYMENVRQNIFNIDSSYMLDICSIYGTYNLHIWDIQATYMQHACSIYAGYTAHNMRHTSHLNATYISHACSIYAAYMAHIICIYEPYKQLICNIHVQYMRHTRQNIVCIYGSYKLYATRFHPACSFICITQASSCICSIYDTYSLHTYATSLEATALSSMNPKGKRIDFRPYLNSAYHRQQWLLKNGVIPYAYDFIIIHYIFKIFKSRYKCKL